MQADGATPADSLDTAVLRALCARHGDAPERLIEILHDLQELAGHVPEAALPVIAEALNLGRAEVHGVASFYHDFRRAPAGPVVVRLCRAEACQARGALALIDEALEQRGAALGETAADGVTLEAVYCLGNCALGPAGTVNGRLHGRLGADRLERLVAEAFAEEEAR
ncbi:formate dehydrogenase gamma subunit [Tistlia consotensis]|uniref:Formate dehydrogenase gamma subunit n=1 Tax=Tistlia consotensis USBA 355 TaxID=560819 RepID=A0A1Y6B437_9PROT|nr:NAD(P)H-dependent oxidoreductase subunit E [Tistlia consotensis]SME88361.1 formate dehydrogenase gamma subunit [Tistlia consotensis USBA 355]SNR24816.1 formate dehydrogenase gamma subunit [Tistlia consotensis]